MNTPASLTLCYITARREPMFQWWADAIHRQCGGDYTGLRILVIDFYAEAHKPEDRWTAEDAALRRNAFRSLCRCPDFTHSAPIWGPWQGPHRLTRENWWAKADYMNAAVALCRDDFLCCCDDLSVPMPGWLEAVRQALQPNLVTFGAYRKVNELQVEEGLATHFTDHPNGKDMRFFHGRDNCAVPCRGGWLFGCCFVIPVEVALRVNGWPQLSNGLGYEDSFQGIVFANTQGVLFQYDRRMMIYESEERHHTGKPVRREDPGLSPNDKSHALKRLAEHTARWENTFGAEGLAGVRSRWLAGAPLPVLGEPTVEWFTKTPLSAL